MHVAVIGSGYVGLVSGACFADFGHQVACIDSDERKIEALNRAVVPIYEPGLDELVERNLAAGRLTFSTELAPAVREADVVMIAVGTPSRRGNGHADLSYVMEAARQIAEALEGFTVVVNKSTVPVGSGDEVERVLRGTRPGVDLAVASNPEFLREGSAIDDFKRPDRIVVGVEDERARAVMEALYRPLYLNVAPLVFTDRRSAELIKYASNAFLATKITFINEIADLCEKVGANVQEVARGIGLDNRIGSKFLHAGPGFGGSCFPKDTRALALTAQEYGSPVRIVETVIQVNEARRNSLADRVIAACGGSVAGKRIGLLGLAFKPNTDDMREAPALDMIPTLEAAGAVVSAYDPEATEQARSQLPNVVYARNAYEALDGADVLVLLTEWDEFRALDLARVKRVLREPIVVDLRNVYRPEEMQRHGFVYYGIGRPNG
ncbi:UDP-glucose/GDP-mannose dehydrogenase family protein [Hansschlegelia sp.]|uniref:UDP-glucose dehydrogenase family protein n=1 Tax=Hansschlegelia sp. TaxID=2041892 RepID=UPI002B529EC0|nr:UDP-glucose/GDP-mannose dehydrogenase family protein [Hansschlegelia sp.]HVI28039.1 UDP-glucose/GDP-mannose dehydrogenase family protein [Hansschlegelia sp.]